MPQIFSRMDSANWMTPSIADILDQGAAPPGGDGSIRERMLTIQQELTDLETPARIVNVRSMPSYTLYVARPETVGRMGNRRTVTPPELRKSIAQIAEKHKDWMLGFLPQLQDTAEAVGILLRTEEHRPQSLRRLLVRSNFRNHESTLAYTIGITLEQQLIVNDLSTTPHLLIVGTNKAKLHLVRGALLTLVCLNTPGELRVALMGQSCEFYKDFSGTPHALGRLLVGADEAQRLLDGLLKEIQRREQMFEEQSVENIEQYNAKLREDGKTEFPRIVLTIDSISDSGWQNAKVNWAPSVIELLAKGAKAGIHLILTVAEVNDQNIPPEIFEAISTQVIMRVNANDIGDNLENFHPSLMRFIDAFVIEGQGDNQSIIPLELCAISSQEIQRAVTYWQEAAKYRLEETLKTGNTTATGVTDILKPPVEEPKTLDASPPIPAKPSIEVLSRATKTLAAVVATNTPNQNGYASHATQPLIQQAKALAAYLGWIGIGPLHDIFGLSTEEALSVIAELQHQNVLEVSDSPILRFLRLTQPNEEFGHG